MDRAIASSRGITDGDTPAMFRAADNLSARSQSLYFRLYLFHLTSMAAGVVMVAIAGPYIPFRISLYPPKLSTFFSSNCVLLSLTF